MSMLLERLRAALAVDYEVLGELASGGMGVVFRARDRQLQRLVAIKIIRPEVATAATAARFLREARTLASFTHPNIVPVHRAGEADGFSYFVMDLLEGETLASRLARGPLPPDEARRVADELLAALEAVHQRGVVHRDVKPSNVFLSGGRALLGDFGIARTADTTELTQAGHIVGTPAFMPPEQHAGSDVGATTDVCAAGMVIYQAFTGRTWTFDSRTDGADWGGVPPDLVPALRRALAWTPAERFSSGGEFRRALDPGTVRGRRWPLAAGAGVALAAASVWFWPSPAPPPVDAGAALRVRLGTLVAEGVGARLADSISAALALALRAAPDVAFLTTSDPHADLEIAGRLARAGDSLRVSVTAVPRRAGGGAFARTITGTRAGIVDAVARELLLAVWSARDTTFRDLPVRALPRSPTGLALWARAEALHAGAQWSAAAQAYDEAYQADTTCALCAFRRVTITRWLRENVDTALTARVARSIDDFTPPYQLLIRASTSPGDRWEALERVTTLAPRFSLGHFVYGDELFHRGPLSGFSRDRALQEFALVVALRKEFVPGWEHLTWVAIAEGDSVLAARALRQFVERSAPDEPHSQIQRALFSVGFAWRFEHPLRAAATTEFVLANPTIAEFPDLRSGPRYLLVFDAPDGVTWLGTRFEHWPGRPDLRTPGLVGQIVGHFASGRADSAHAAIGRLRGESADLEHALAAAEFEAAWLLFDSLPLADGWPRVRRLLEPVAGAEAATPLQRRRAAWLLSLLARRAGADPSAWRHAIAGESAPAPFATLLAADARASGAPRDSERRTRPLLALDSAGRAGDPFFRAALHLLRAEWLAAAGDRDAARRELLWAGNYDVTAPTGAPLQAEDADWALGTLARWRRAGLAIGAGREACRDLADVARLWQRGDARYRARADSAAQRHRSLGCAG